MTPIVPAHVQHAVKEMYEERDARGRRLWSHAAIAKQLMLSETTVYRIVNGLGAYQGADKFKVGAALEAAAKASQAKFAEMLKQELTAPKAAPKAAPVAEEDEQTKRARQIAAERYGVGKPSDGNSGG